jgi:hypothetical protein
MTDEHTVDRAQQFWLAQPTEAFRLGTGDLAKKARRLERDARNMRAQTYVAAFFNVTVWTVMFFVEPAWGARVGALIALLGWAFGIQQVTSHSRRTIDAYLELAEMPVASFYRDALERERSFFVGKRFWLRWLSMVAGPVVFCLGIGIHYRDAFVLAAMIAVTFIALSALAIRGRNTKIAHIGKQLDQLQLYEETPP